MSYHAWQAAAVSEEVLREQAVQSDQEYRELMRERALVHSLPYHGW